MILTALVTLAVLGVVVAAKDIARPSSAAPWSPSWPSPPSGPGR